MPNWVTNSLTVTGHGAGQFFAEVQKLAPEKRFIAHFVPMPDELKGIHEDGQGSAWRQDDTGNEVVLTDEEKADLVQRFGAFGWYEWALRYWGTRWDACRVEQLSADRLVFETAWSPPVYAIRTISQKFPSAVFTLAYAEGDMGFFGSVVFSDAVMSDVFESDSYWSAGQDTDLTEACSEHLGKYSLSS